MSLLIVVPLGEAATTRAVSDRYLDRPSSLLAAYRAAWGRLGALITMILVLIGAYLGSIVVVVLLIVLLSLAGAGALGALLAILAAIALIPALLFFYIRTAVAVPAIVLERVSGWQGLRRSWNLINGRFWATFGRMALLWIIAAIISSVVAAIFEIPGSAFDPQQLVRLRPGGKCYRSGLRRPDHLHRRDAAVLRHPHPQRRLRHRDARAVAVRRLLAAFAVSAALTSGVLLALPVQAAGPCVTLEYLMLLGGADNALTAAPAQPAAALTTSPRRRLSLRRRAPISRRSSLRSARRHLMSPEANSASI